MLAGTLATVLDAVWQRDTDRCRLDPLIHHLIKRSPTTILIDGPQKQERLKDFVYAYIQLATQVLEGIHQQRLANPEDRILFQIYCLLSQQIDFNTETDSLNLLALSYLLLRIVEELEPYRPNLNQYDITLANTLVHSLLEPLDVSPLDERAEQLSTSLKQEEAPVTKAEALATIKEHSPCFSESWGIRWCVALGV